MPGAVHLKRYDNIFLIAQEEKAREKFPLLFHMLTSICRINSADNVIKQGRK